MGAKKRVFILNLEFLFPKLRGTEYQITSPVEPGYNCIAWAAGDDTRWWEPDPDNSYYWPQNVPRRYTVEAYAEVFRRLGFEVCQDTNFKVGIEKVAIFAGTDGLPTHATRQLSDGTWTSKLGQSEDIRHQKLHHVSGESYGFPVLFMQRRRIVPNSTAK